MLHVIPDITSRFAPGTQESSWTRQDGTKACISAPRVPPNTTDISCSQLATQLANEVTDDK